MLTELTEHRTWHLASGAVLFVVVVVVAGPWLSCDQEFPPAHLGGGLALLALL